MSHDPSINWIYFQFSHFVGGRNTSQSINVSRKIWPSSLEATPTWFQVSENDRIIYPGAERNFTERMNATTLSLNSSHASLVSHPDEIAELILNATKGSTK